MKRNTEPSFKQEVKNDVSTSSAQESDEKCLNQLVATFLSWSDGRRDQFLQNVMPSFHQSQVNLLSKTFAPLILPHLAPQILSSMKNHGHSSSQQEISVSNITLDMVSNQVKLKRPTQEISPNSGKVFSEEDVIDLYISKKGDFLRWLPYDASMKILNFLDPVSIARCSCVNKHWRNFTLTENIWRPFFTDSEWSWGNTDNIMARIRRQIDEVEDSIREQYQDVHGVDLENLMDYSRAKIWKYWFVDCYRIRRNWEKGHFSLRTFEGHTQGISCLQFNDKHIVSGSSDLTLRLWELRTNTYPLLTLKGHLGTIRCVHLDSKKVISGSNDRTIRVWDIEEGSEYYGDCIGMLEGHLAPVRCMQCINQVTTKNSEVHGEYSLLISGSYDFTIKIWELKFRIDENSHDQKLTHSCLRTLEGHTGPVLCIHYNPAESGVSAKLASGSADGTIRLWDPDSGECLRIFSGHSEAVTCLQFDEKKIISGSIDSNLKVWNMDSGNCIELIDWMSHEGHRGVIRNLKFDKRLLLSSSDDKTIKVWRIPNPQKEGFSNEGVTRRSKDYLCRMLTLKRHTDGVTCLQFDHRMIVSGSYDKSIKIWDFSAP